MKRYLTLLFGAVVAAGLIIFIGTVISNHGLAVLDAKGEIAQQQRDLLIFTSLLSLVVVIPVFTMIAVFSIRYREGNPKATYRPDWDHSRIAETIWWGIPIVLISILAVVTWQSSHALDPFRPLTSSKQPVEVQVIALQWKWLFIYPEEQIATINDLRVPVDRPLNLTLTADAPMNSFWVPQLGGQVYTMPGMSTKLHLKADEAGSYRGSSANLSGEGFSDMDFVVTAMEEQDYTTWISETAQTAPSFDSARYALLRTPTIDDGPAYFRVTDRGVYDSVIAQYMHTGSSAHKQDSGHYE